jgi:hypothetical protein
MEVHSTHSQHCHQTLVSGQFHTTAALTLGEASSLYSLNSRLGGPRRGSGRSGDEEVSVHAKNRTPIHNPKPGHYAY